LISATIRSADRRAGGTMNNAVIAATGQATAQAFTRLSRTLARQPRSRTLTRDAAIDTITLDISVTGIDLCLACMISLLSATLFLNHIARRGPAASSAAGSLKSR
jgi:hypothetical protein